MIKIGIGEKSQETRKARWGGNYEYEDENMNKMANFSFG